MLALQGHKLHIPVRPPLRKASQVAAKSKHLESKLQELKVDLGEVELVNLNAVCIPEKTDTPTAKDSTEEWKVQVCQGAIAYRPSCYVFLGGKKGEGQRL